MKQFFFLNVFLQVFFNDKTNLFSGATFVPSLANLEGDETFEASYLGEAAEVCQQRISDDELILVKGTKARTASSIILRGPNDFYCDEMERSVHDALCVVKVGKICMRLEF